MNGPLDQQRAKIIFQMAFKTNGTKKGNNALNNITTSEWRRLQLNTEIDKLKKKKMFYTALCLRCST